MAYQNIPEVNALKAHCEFKPRNSALGMHFEIKLISYICVTILINSQKAGLRPAMLAIAVLVRRGNFGKFVLSRFHEHRSILSRWYITTKTGRVLCNKTFSVRKSMRARVKAILMQIFKKP